MSLAMNQPMSEEDEEEEEEEEEKWDFEGRVRLQQADYLHAWLHVPQHQTIWLYLFVRPCRLAADQLLLRFRGLAGEL